MRRFLGCFVAMMVATPGVATAASGRPPLGYAESVLLAFVLGLLAGGIGFHLLWNGRRREARLEPEKGPPPSPPKIAEPAPVVAVALPVATPERRAAPRNEPARIATPATGRPRVSGMEVVEAHELTDQGSTDLYQTVAGVLLRTLESSPARNDLRSKLLEVLFQSSRSAEFERHAIEYQCHQRSTADPRWPEICDMAHALGLANPLFGPLSAVASPTAVAEPAPRAGQRYHDSLDTDRLREATERLSAEYEALAARGTLFRDYTALLCCHLPRPTPLQWGERIGKIFGNTTLVLKREELRVPFEAEMMNAIGQVLVATELKKRRVLTGTRSGDSGIAVARAASMFGLDCRVYVSAAGQVSESTVRHIRSFGAEIVRTPAGEGEDSRRRALGDWLADPEHSLFVSGVHGGPRAQQKMMFDFSGIVGRECLEQCRAMGIGDLRAIYASTAAGSAGLGFLAPLLDRPQLRRVVTHDGHLERVPFRREHAWLRDSGQVEYETIAADTAMEAQMALARVEGISISLDDARALAVALRHAVDSNERSTAILLLSPATLPPPPPEDEERTIRVPKTSAARDRPISASDFG